MACNRAACQPGAADVHIHDAIPLVDRDLIVGCATHGICQPGIRDETINTFPFLENDLGHSVRCLFGRNVRFDEDRLAAGLANLFSGIRTCSPIDLRNNHACAFVGETLRIGASESSAGPGNDDDLILMLFHFI